MNGYNRVFRLFDLFIVEIKSTNAGLDKSSPCHSFFSRLAFFHLITASSGRERDSLTEQSHAQARCLH